MDAVEQNLVNWQASLLKSIPIAGLLAKDPVAYKWKATFRCWMLREVTFWRVSDLLTQSYALHQQGHSLGARILLRSGFETLAVMIYLNQLIQKVVTNDIDFWTFSEKTTVLLLGSRNGSTDVKSLNIVTILENCDKRYPGLMSLYAFLSESAHPNYEGMSKGYSIIDHDEYETQFLNRWTELHANEHLNSMQLCMETFHHEYDDVWPKRMNALELWLHDNDTELEAAKSSREAE
ncbi:hypothetical protein J2045_003927 [Peteryoungia aggregata LMG 23059]|uniref:Uncharacterized protein n=1 Tax=Peteryoungia aggregata LMG 23059 TaxID=1368425 RepID=A0ABU0GC04_9HYPH|nr:hypothetical protein [Peteryoungia aggregata]MDQ0422877.1 hypothetical protein [Peteryoungia aggregata LMG 23059]